MPKNIRIVSNNTDPDLRRQDYLNVHNTAAAFETNWQESIAADYAMLTAGMQNTELSSVLEAFHLPPDTSMENLVGLARLYCTSNGMSADDVTKKAENDLADRKADLMQNVQQALLGDETRDAFVQQLFGNFNGLDITFPDIGNITADNLDMGTRTARLNRQLMGLGGIGNAFNAPMFGGNAEFTENCNTTVDRSAGIYDSLVWLFGEERYGENANAENVNVSYAEKGKVDPRSYLTLPIILGVSPETMYPGEDSLKMRVDDPQAVSGIDPRLKRIFADMNIGGRNIQNFVEYSPFAENDNENDFRRFDSSALFSYVTGEDVNVELFDRNETLYNAAEGLLYATPWDHLSHIKINGKEIENVTLDEAMSYLDINGDILSQITVDNQPLKDLSAERAVALLNIQFDENETEEERREYMDDILKSYSDLYESVNLMGLDKEGQKKELLRRNIDGMIGALSEETLSSVSINGTPLSGMNGLEAAAAFNVDENLLSQIYINDRPLSDMEREEAVLLFAPNGEREAGNAFFDLVSTNDLLTEDRNNINRLFSNIYVNGKNLSGMGIEEATEAVRESLYTDTGSVLEVRDTETHTLRPFIPESSVSKRSYTALGEAMLAQAQKTEQAETFHDFINDVVTNPTPENFARKGIIQAPAAEGLSAAEYLSAITGKQININDPESIRSAVQNIYIDGRNLADTMGNVITAENLDSYAQTVKDALIPHEGNNHFVSVMERNSVFSDPKAVLSTEYLNDPAMSDNIRQSVGYVQSYRQTMKDAAKDAKEYARALKKHNLNAFMADANTDVADSLHYQSHISQFSVLSGFDRSIAPSLYMISKGYNWEDVFGDDPAFDEAKRQAGKEFFEIMECRKGPDGKALGSADPINVEYYNNTVVPLMENMASALGGIKSEYIDANVKENLPRLAFMNRVYEAGTLFSSIDQPAVSAVRGTAFTTSVFRMLSEAQLNALADDKYTADVALHESFFKSSGDPTAFFGAPLVDYPYDQSAKYMRAIADMSVNMARAGNTDMQTRMMEDYKNGNQKAFSEYINSLDVGGVADVMRRTAINGENVPQDPAEYNEYIHNRVNSSAFGVDYRGYIDPGDWKDIIKKDTGTSFISKLSGIGINKDMPVDKIEAVLDRIYLNDKSLREYIDINPEELRGEEGLRKFTEINAMLKNIAQVSNESKGNTAILTKTPDGRFIPVSVDFGMNLEPEDIELHNSFRPLSDEELGKLSANERRSYNSNLREYNRRKTEVEEHLKSVEGRTFSETYAKALNNTQLTSDEVETLRKKGALPPNIISSKDLEEGGYIFERLAGGSLSDGEKLKSAMDNIYINDKSFYEYFGLDRNNVTPQQIRQKEAEFTQLLNDEFRHDKLNKGDDAKFVLMKDPRSGMFRPVSFHEPVPDLKPEAEPLSGWKKLTASREEKAQNLKDINDYKKSAEDYVKANNRNLGAEERNKAAFAYAKAMNRQTLSDSEKAVLASRETNVPNMDFYGRNTFPTPNVRTLNLSNVQQRSRNSSLQNLSPTGFTNSAEQREREMGNRRN